MRERALLEAVFPVDGIPHLLGTVPGVTREALGVAQQAHVIALGGRAFVVGHAIVSVVALVVVLDHASLSDVFPQFTLQRACRTLALLRLAGVRGQGAFQLPQLARPPDQRDIFLVVQRLHRAGDVAAHAVLVVPEGTFLVEEVQPVVGEEVGLVRQLVERRLDLEVEPLERGV